MASHPESFADLVGGLLAAGVPRSAADPVVDVHADRRVHLDPSCHLLSPRNVVRSRSVLSAVPVRRACRSCAQASALRLTGSPSSRPYQSALSTLGLVLDDASALERARASLRPSRDGDDHQDPWRLVALFRVLAAARAPHLPELQTGWDELVHAGEAALSSLLAALRSDTALAARLRTVASDRSGSFGVPTLFALSDWTLSSVPRRAGCRDALLLVLSFAVTDPVSSSSLVARLPSWATGMVVEDLGVVPSSELGEDAALSPDQFEALLALWPQAPLGDAVEMARLLVP